MAFESAEPGVAQQPANASATSTLMMNYPAGVGSGPAPTTLVDVLMHSPLNAQWSRGLITVHNNDAIKLVLTHSADSPAAPLTSSSQLSDCLPTLPPESVIKQPKRSVLKKCFNIF